MIGYEPLAPSPADTSRVSSPLLVAGLVQTRQAAFGSRQKSGLEAHDLFFRRLPWGGTRNGTIVHWPSGINAKGEIRSQFCHVIDVAPSILEAAGLPEPVSVNGVQQAH